MCLTHTQQIYREKQNRHQNDQFITLMVGNNGIKDNQRNSMLSIQLSEIIPGLQ